jgi:heme A synthase
MFFYIHSGVRYLVLLAAVLNLGYALFGLLTRRPYDPTMLWLARIFAGLVHLQVLLGIALLFSRRFYPALIGHVMMMIFAAVTVTIVPAVMRRRDPAARGWLPHLIGTAIAIVLIVFGIMAIGRSPLGMTAG